MVLDTSAIVAIALNELDLAALEERIADDPIRLISAATVLEATIMLETRLGDAGGREFDLWLFKVGAEIVPVDARTNRCRASSLALLRQGPPCRLA